MIEIIKKGEVLDLNTSQIVTFKKSQELNGIQNQYSYSNTGTMPKTGRNLRILDLFELPNGKLKSLSDAHKVDVILNQSIHLRDQTMTIKKESANDISWFLIFTDSSIVLKMKALFIGDLLKDFLYKKTAQDAFDKSEGENVRFAAVKTGENSNLYVIEEMPISFRLTYVIKLALEKIGFGLYGDFSDPENEANNYWIAPNKGVYEVYKDGEGFVPSFDPLLTAYSLFSSSLKLFNMRASVDEKYKTVSINSWNRIDEYKTDYVDYSRFYIGYEDYAFESKLAKKNFMKYSDSNEIYNSSFNNSLSSSDSADYLTSEIGTGSLRIFDDSELNQSGIIQQEEKRTGDTAAIKIYQISEEKTLTTVYSNGNAITNVPLYQAVPVPMRQIYDIFHRRYIDFIVSPVVANISMRYDDIMTADFDMSKVFFVDQLASYWIPLELSFSTKKDGLKIKAMLMKKRFVKSPILNNYNSVLLNFRERVEFPLENIQSMYPMPPNEFKIKTLIFTRYDDNLNQLIVNGVYVPSNALPKTYDIEDVVSIELESGKVGDIRPDKVSASMYLQVIDENGGISNEAYINIVHTGVGFLESNFKQPADFHYRRDDFDSGELRANVLEYIQGPRPNINNTITSVKMGENDGGSMQNFDIIDFAEPYFDININMSSYNLYLRTQNNRSGKARARVYLVVDIGPKSFQIYEYYSGDSNTTNVVVPARTVNIPSVKAGERLRVFFFGSFDNRRGSNSGSMDVEIGISNFKANVTTKQII